MIKEWFRDHKFSEEHTAYVVILGLAVSFVIYHIGILEWWRALLLAVTVIGTSLILLRSREKHIVLIVKGMSTIIYNGSIKGELII